jgi:hypothetical protein
MVSRPVRKIESVKIEVEAANPSRAEVAERTKPGDINDANGALRDSKKVFRQPTATEVSSLTFGSLPEVRIHSQELRNQFAHLLNRGSSLE